MEQWKQYRLGDILSISSGLAYKGEYLGKGDSFLLGMGCVSYSEQFLEKGMRQYEGTYDDRYSLETGDIVLATRQQSDNLPILGMPAIIPQKFHGQKMVFGANLYKVNLISSDFSNSFIYWLLKTPNYIRHIKSCQTGTTVRMITKANIEDYTFYCPEKSERERISSFLWNIENKIELNRRINDNLEQQAQALFKSWFVDFEPFRGGKFVESQLGMIPKGWKVGTLSDLLDIRYGKDHKKLNDGNIPVYGSGGIMRLADGILYNGESVLIPRKGTLNNVLYVNWPFWTVDTMFYSIEKVPNVAKYCHLLLSKLDLASMNSGSAVPSMTTDILNKIQIIVANQDVFSSFNECISSLYLKAKINLDENKRLSETRDLLLPKLMSGRLIIKDLHS